MVKNKCSNCSKKTLFLNDCKCLKHFCLNCLPYYNHTCNFDWKTNKKDDLNKNNPQIIPIKVSSI